MRLLMLILFVFSNSTFAKVIPPNYDFSMDTLSEFFPGKDISAVETKYGKPESLRDDGAVKMARFKVKQMRYLFPVIVQYSQGKILDMHATLPSYFLHDIFHQSLINRWGKQQTYQRVDEEAFYEWKNPEFIMSYGASCTITCFPTYLSVKPSPEKSAGGFKSISEILSRK